MTGESGWRGKVRIVGNSSVFYYDTTVSRHMTDSRSFMERSGRMINVNLGAKYTQRERGEFFL